MRTTSRLILKRTTKSLVLAGAAIAALSLAATPAEAHGHGHGQGNHAHGHAGYGAVYAPGSAFRPGVVPRRIIYRDVRAYSPWYGGTVWYGPHHHAHAIYRFPVYVNGAVVYQPYTYCGEDVFVGAGVALPRVALDVQLGPGRDAVGIGISTPHFGFYFRDDH
jgi:hypothetical protein